MQRQEDITTPRGQMCIQSEMLPLTISVLHQENYIYFLMLGGDM